MKLSFLAFAFAILCQAASADPAPIIHYAPAENLEHIDVALIDSARYEIDFAAYVLTDWPVMQALKRAADRGVNVRIYLDGTQFAEREPTRVFEELAQTRGAKTRLSCISRATKLTGSCYARARRTSQHPASSDRTMT
jgi:phosphatidylserine/phosphatidylglycerophosphate/cardiolipin synthase-like enzyme